MALKKLLIAVVAGFLVMFILAGVWHAIMADFYQSFHPGTEGHDQMGAIVLGYLILTFLMAYIYPKGYAGGSPVKEGLKFGVIIGLLWILPHSLVLLGNSASTSASSVKLIVNTIWHVVEQGAGGIVIGMVYGKRATP